MTNFPSGKSVEVRINPESCEQTQSENSCEVRKNNVMRKLDTLVADFPDTYKLIEQNEVSKTYSFLKSYVSYHKPR